MSVRSSVKANWISRQYASSPATSSAARPATAAVAALTSWIPGDRSANAAPVALPAIRRNERRLHINVSSWAYAAQYTKHRNGSIKRQEAQNGFGKCVLCFLCFLFSTPLPGRTKLRAHQCCRVAPVVVAVLEQRPNLKHVSRSRRQNAHSDRRSHGRDRLGRPWAGDPASADRGVTQFVTEGLWNGLEPNHDLSAVGAVIDAADLLGQLLLRRANGRERLKSARREDRHVVLAGELHITSQQPHHLNDSFTLLPLFSYDLLAAIERFGNERQETVVGRFQGCWIDRRVQKMR